ncbi:hypothetical protein BDK63_002203 [Halomonas campaniensis]|uniref:Uncharacterized protein n=1 Tax=Halomonas campaniensis TaxID=213554 RepID=A0A7W5K3J6_9GAMM|nr:hypothetical protein [Halomonas campaniensis]MBB3331320.1 hypothetical protein [Halomonas campaniensis]
MPRALDISAADGTIDAHLFTPAGAPSYDAAADALHHRRLAMLLEETL